MKVAVEVRRLATVPDDSLAIPVFPVKAQARCASINCAISAADEVALPAGTVVDRFTLTTMTTALASLGNSDDLNRTTSQKQMRFPSVYTHIADQEFHS